MSSTQDRPAEQILCPSCFAENAPDVDFCTKCGRPMSSMATIDPLRRAWSLGFFCRTAAENPPSLIVLWGAWLLLGSMAFASLAMAALTFLEADEGHIDGMDVVFGIFSLAFAAFLGSILARMTARYVRAKREHDSRADADHTDAHPAE
jgi:hypothetical protein